MALTEKQIYDIIKIVVTALLSIASTILVTNCTTSLTIQRNCTSSGQNVDHSMDVSADSASVQLHDFAK